MKPAWIDPKAINKTAVTEALFLMLHFYHYTEANDGISVIEYSSVD